jgi:hypothetical protein
MTGINDCSISFPINLRLFIHFFSWNYSSIHRNPDFLKYPPDILIFYHRHPHLSNSMTAGIRKKTPEKTGEDDIKKSLMNKYGEMFVDKLTSEDLDEFQFFLKKQYDKESGWNNEYKLKFESKLRQYFHEEVMKREIASIETLLGLLDRRDLKK